MRFFFLITTLILGNTLFSQDIDFNQYEPLSIKGEIPEIVTRSLSDIYNEFKGESIEGVGYSRSLEYYQETNLALREMLNSGLVLFNDPITEYVEQVGRKVISSDDDLSDIQFFTIRSNIVNAFVTPQGVVFVTQGLVAQLENEAQLAYILAHEIAHYKLDHNVTKYQERVRVMREGGSYSRRIKKLSNYSKDKEFGADSLGIHYFHQAKYAKSELFSVFDVLSYSYLPFDLVPFPKDYFNTDHIFVPEELFVDDLPKISFDEDYDDSKSSHPNIESRREKLEEWTADIENWGGVVFHFSKEEFNKVREIARFESIRNDLYDVRPVGVLYNIFLLEQNHPDNEYLQIAKAKAWSQMISLREEGEFYRQVARASEVQGAPHRLVKFLRSIDREPLYTLAFRVISDIHEIYSDNKELQGLYKFTLRELAKADEFDPRDYKKLSYQEGLANFQAKRDSLIYLDSLANNQEIADSIKSANNNVSKYDKIRDQNDTEEAVSVKDSFDIQKFYLYGLSDRIDSAFLDMFQEIKDEVEEERQRKEDFDNLSRKERKKIRKDFEKNGMKRGIEDIVILPPHITLTSSSGNRKHQRSAKAEEYLLENVERIDGSGNLNVSVLSADNNALSTLDFIRGQNIAINAIRQMTMFDDIELYPIEGDRLEEFGNNMGSTNIGLYLVENYKNSLMEFSMIWSIYLPPIFVIQLINNAFKMNEMDYTFALFDVSNGEFDIEVVHTTTLHGSRSKGTILAMLNYYLNELSQPYEK